MEYTISNVSKEVIKNVLSNDKLYDLLDLSCTNNLRSLIKLNKIINEENIEIKKENQALIQAILYAIESIDNGNFNRNSLLEKRIKTYTLFKNLYRNSQLDEIKQQKEEISSFKDEKVFSESVKDKFFNIKKVNLIKNLEQIYMIIKYGDYSKLQTIEFDYSKSLEQQFFVNYENLKFIINKKNLKEILDSIDNALIEGYDKMSLFENYTNFYCRYYKYLKTYKLVSLSENLMNKVINAVINELLNYNYEWNIYFNKLLFGENEKIAKGKYDEIIVELGKKFQK